MGAFDDAKVDKDLLSQIFADDGDDVETDTLLDEMLKDVEEEASKKNGEVPKEDAELPREDSVLEVEDLEEEEMESLIEEQPKEQTPEQEPLVEKEAENIPASMPVFETNTENDPVLEEAKQIMEEEGRDGTITKITAGTTIRGGISSDASLEIMGVITGDVECQKKVVIAGSVTGNVIASEIYISSKRLEGGLSSEGAVKIGVGTVVIGDVDAASAYIAGAVKGDIDVNGDVVIDSTAIVQGDIKAKSIQINKGAVVDGHCSLDYADVNLVDFFAGVGTD